MTACTGSASTSAVLKELHESTDHATRLATHHATHSRDTEFRSTECHAAGEGSNSAGLSHLPKHLRRGSSLTRGLHSTEGHTA